MILFEGYNIPNLMLELFDIYAIEVLNINTKEPKYLHLAYTSIKIDEEKLIVNECETEESYFIRELDLKAIKGVLELEQYYELLLEIEEKNTLYQDFEKTKPSSYDEKINYLKQLKFKEKNDEVASN